MKKIYETFSHHGMVAKVYRAPDTDEFIAKVYVNGTHVPDADYFTNDRDDACQTAAVMAAAWGCTRIAA